MGAVAVCSQGPLFDNSPVERECEGPGGVERNAVLVRGALAVLALGHSTPGYRLRGPLWALSISNVHPLSSPLLSI